ncbi:MAG: pseudouridine synthase, partial [Dongiaceae bacterium]
REVRRICEHLGWAVGRLIRIAFGPFQLGDLARGAVEEVPARVLREQLGDGAPRPTLRHSQRRKRPGRSNGNQSRRNASTKGSKGQQP